MWLNENAGILVLVLGIIGIVLTALVLWLVFSLRSRFAVQRLKFVGLYSTDMSTRTPYAALTIGNRSVSEIAIREIGIKNGGVAFDLTKLYREKAALDARARIVIEQRHSIDFTLSVSELEGVLIDGQKGKELRTLRLYALDLMGNVYEGRIGAVKKLLAAARKGTLAAQGPASAAPAPQSPAKNVSATGAAHSAQAEHSDVPRPDAVTAGVQQTSAASDMPETHDDAPVSETEHVKD